MMKLSTLLLFMTLCTNTVAMTMSSTGIPSRMPACSFKHRKQDMPSIFSVNGTDLPSNRRQFQISAEGYSECFINLTEVVETYNFPETPEIGYFEFVCAMPLRLHIEQYHGETFTHIIQYIKIVKCVTSLTDLNEIAAIGTARVIFVLESVFVPDDKAENGTQCSNLRGIASFAYSYPVGGTNYNANFDDILRCASEFYTLAEVIFSGMAWSTLPSALEQKCPNLQSLDIPKNNFSKPPTIFPWTKHVFNLPGGLARSTHLQTHYVTSEYLDISNNIFRRTYRLDDNSIRNLTDFSFEGFLHYISLQRNGMVGIGENTFSNVSGVQYISLGENELTSLPCNVFKPLTELTNLDLSKNQLTSLCDRTFDSLVELKNLNLANNSLMVLGEGLFKSLKNLKLLHLEFNELIILQPNSFPFQSLELKEIYLFDNPLEHLPEFIFWIRSLRKIDLHKTDITLSNFTYFLENMDERLVEESLAHSLSYIDYKETANQAKENPKVVDLGYSRITGFNLEPNMSAIIQYRLRLLLINFKFILKGNPLFCDCNILPIKRFVNNLLSNESIDPARFMDWRCVNPVELKGKPLIHVRDEETYCSIEIKHCPLECSCFQREANDHIIVDCRSRNLSKIHDSLPQGALELWYSNNAIRKLSANPNLLRAISIDVSSNKIDYIDEFVSSQIVNTKRLLVQDNLLAYLPQGFEKLTFESLLLSPNPLSCDCKTLWMKTWLLRQVRAIKDLSKITCFVNNEDGKLVINVPDEQFVCDESPKVDTLKHIVLPSVISTIIAVLFLIVLVVIYAYRQECKVLMFVYFGVHPFDKDSDCMREYIDCIVVHSGEQTSWVMDNIVQLLENGNFAYKVCDMARDFVVGLSFQENLTRTVKHSKRIVFCLTEDWDCSSESFILSWKVAQEKIKETRCNFGIVVTHKVSKDQIKDKELLRFLKRKRNVDTKERLFTKKLLYYMPSVADAKDSIPKLSKVSYVNQLSVSEVEDNSEIREVNDGMRDDVEDADSCHAFISYCDDDIDCVTKQLQPLLEEQGFRLCIPDRDFIAGESKEANILHAIHSCKRTILVLSKSHIQDEWSLFTFRQAFEKSLRQKNNHLVVILLGEVGSEQLDGEIQQYLNHYITLRVDDIWFQQKLFNGLPLLKGKEHLRTSPLYTRSKAEYVRDTDSISIHF